MVVKVQDYVDTVMNTVQDGFFIADQKGIIQEANSVLGAIFSCNQIEIIGKHLNFLLPNLINSSCSDSTAIKSLGEIHEFLAQRHDGSTFIVSILINEICIENKLMLIGTIRDIGDRKEIENALAESRNRLQLFIEGARDGMWDWPDIEQDNEYWSPQWKKLLGYEEDEIEAKASTFFAMLHPDDMQRTNEIIQQSMETDDFIDLEYRLRTKSGEYKWFQVKAQHTMDPLSGKRRMTGSITDINDRKLAEEELIETKKFQDLIKESNPDLLFVKDSDFRIIDANQVFLNVYPTEMQGKIIGYTTLEGYEDNEADAFLEMDKKAFDEGYSEKVETIRFPDGESRTLHTQKIRFENNKNEVFILGIGRDVTRQENLIEKLKASNEELEHFAYIASHDLQEPLRMIVSFTNLLTKEYSENLDADGLEYLKFSSEAALRMQLLVNDLLEYSRLGQASERFLNVNCSDAFNHACANLAETIKQHSAKVTSNLLPEILGNPIRFTRLLQNLIGNSIKYTKPEVEPEIYVAALENDTEWIFSVSDNGIGMKEEYLSQIFIPFKRLHSYSEYDGSGIGLAVSKKIVESLGGKIWAESVFGQGSTFFFTVPKSKNSN